MPAPTGIVRHSELPRASMVGAFAHYRRAISYFGTYEGRPIEVVVWTRPDGVREVNCSFRDGAGPSAPRSAVAPMIEAIRKYGFRDEDEPLREASS
jgi:hypothetical protein